MGVTQCKCAEGEREPVVEARTRHEVRFEEPHFQDDRNRLLTQGSNAPDNSGEDRVENGAET